MEDEEEIGTVLLGRKVHCIAQIVSGVQWHPDIWFHLSKKLDACPTVEKGERIGLAA